MSELTHINCVALTANCFPVGKPVVPAALMNRPTLGERRFAYWALFRTHGIRIYVHWSCHLSRRSPTIFSAAMENRCSSFILSRFSGCILKLILRTMLTTSSGTVVGGVGFLGNRLS